MRVPLKISIFARVQGAVLSRSAINISELMSIAESAATPQSGKKRIFRGAHKKTLCVWVLWPGAIATADSLFKPHTEHRRQVLADDLPGVSLVFTDPE